MFIPEQNDCWGTLYNRNVRFVTKRDGQQLFGIHCSAAGESQVHCSGGVGVQWQFQQGDSSYAEMLQLAPNLNKKTTSAADTSTATPTTLCTHNGLWNHYRSVTLCLSLAVETLPALQPKLQIQQWTNMGPEFWGGVGG